MMTIPILSHDVVREIVSYLENDRYALRSCILVDRLWCQIGIEIFWRNLWKFRLIVGVTEDEYRFWGAILKTLTSCLPNSSKELLMSNGVNVSSYNPRVQLFDYPAYSKSLDCVAVSAMIEMITYIEHQHERPRRLLYIQHLLEQEICKMYINKCTISVLILEHIPLAYFPRAQECFSSLTELRCHTAINETLFFAMAQFCRNIERITIEFFDDDNLGLASLIEMQQDNLKYVKCLGDILGDNKFGAIVDVFRKNARFYTHLDLMKFPCIQPVTITTTMNLQSLKINLIGSTQEIWTELSNAYLPKLEILHLHFDLFSLDVTRRIIANNDGNLYNIVVDFEPEDDQSDALNDTIAQYCPNLTLLVTWFLNNEWHVLENMMARCQGLKYLILRSIECRIDGDMLLKLLCSANTPKSLQTLGLSGNWEFSTQRLKSFLKDCKKKKKRIAFYFSDNEIDLSKEHREIFKNYHKKGVIRWYKIETSFKLDLFL